MKKFLVLVLLMNVFLFAGFLVQGSRQASSAGGFGGAATDKRFCADANGDGKIDMSDAMTVLSFLFMGSRAPYCIAEDRSLDDLVSLAQLESLAARVQAVEGLAARVTALEGLVARVTALEGVAGRVTALEDLPARVAALESAPSLAQLSCAPGQIPKWDGTKWACAEDNEGGGEEVTPEQKEILGHLSVVQLDDGQGGKAKTIRLSGANLQVVNGGGHTQNRNGLGNIIVGYNESRQPTDPLGPDLRTGSHNIVVGEGNNYSGTDGLVVGVRNSILAWCTSVAGGHCNTASGVMSSVGGGVGNTASGVYAVVSGGSDNTAIADQSTVSGGDSNIASGVRSCVSGGVSNTASGDCSSVTGGARNKATYNMTTVTGGDDNTASGFYSSVHGGCWKTATEDCSTAP